MALLVGGIVLRLALAFVADSRVRTPWHIGGDAEIYALLASNVARGAGFSYAGQPTAFRPPLYPLFLAGMMHVFGSGYLLAVRLLQCAIGLGTVWFCWRIAVETFGDDVGWLAAFIAMYFPTLFVFPSELMTECFATFLAAAFFYLIFDDARLPRLATAVWLGLIVGLATMLRFNMAILGPVAIVWIILRSTQVRRALPSVAIVTLIAAAIVAPWIVRNEIVFHGRVLLSTQAGYNAVQGILTPEGRVQVGDLDILRNNGSWLSGDLETNDPNKRLPLGPEPQLDRHERELARGLWRKQGWRLVPLSLQKLGYFWLATDELVSTGSFSWNMRIARAAGVILYWFALCIGILGWFGLHRERPALSRFLLGYVVLISLVHLPFGMSSRYGIPFFDPLLVVLVGAGCFQGRRWLDHRLVLSRVKSDSEAI